MSALEESASQSRLMTGHENQTVSNRPNVPLIDNIDAGQIIVPERKSWKNLFVYFGPGFLVSIAYIDLGNFETDLQSGAQYKYELLWIMLVASCAALIIQSLATKLRVVTGTTFFSIQHWFCLECPWKVEFKAICDCFTGFWPKFYNYRNLCWTVFDAGLS